MMSGGVPNDWTHNENVSPVHGESRMHLQTQTSLAALSLVVGFFLFFLCSCLSGHLTHQPHAATKNKTQPYSRQTKLFPQPVEHHEELYWKGPVQDPDACKCKNSKHNMKMEVKLCAPVARNYLRLVTAGQLQRAAVDAAALDRGSGVQRASGPSSSVQLVPGADVPGGCLFCVLLLHHRPSHSQALQPSTGGDL